MMMKYDYSIEHVMGLRSTALKRNLYAPHLFWAVPLDVLCACYNGVGPDAWSQVLRAFVTRVLDMYEEDALIHDFEFAFAPRTYGAFTLANLRFAWNATVNAFYCVNLITGFQHVIFGMLLALLCQLFGWRGFKHAVITSIVNDNETKELSKI